MAPSIIALDRLKSQLLTSGIQEKNNALFQVINQLIDYLRATTDMAAAASAAASGSGGGGGGGGGTGDDGQLKSVMYSDWYQEDTLYIPQPPAIVSPEPRIFLLENIIENYDGLVVPYYSGDPIAAEITTTGNIDDLDFGNVSLLRVNNSSLTTIRGLKAGRPGQRLTLCAVGSANVGFAHQNAGSSAGNRLINFATSADTLISPTGTMTYVYDAVTARWRIADHFQGPCLNVPYNGANFTASAGTWTVDVGDVLSFVYTLVNTVLTFAYSFQTTSVSATPLQLKFVNPGGYTAGASAAAWTFTAGQYNDAGAWVWNGGVESNPTQIFLYHALGATNWATTVNLTYVKGMCSIEVA